jgi:radical SAM-linked protein
VEGDLRFLSHHDLMRLLERAAARAGLPLRYSQGYNPRPRISLPVPRPVGVASRCELMTMEFDRQVEEGAWGPRLAGQLPPGIPVRGVQALATGGAVRVTAAAYELPLEGDEPDRVAARLGELSLPGAADDQESPQPSQGDIRRCLRQARLEDGRLSFVLQNTPAGPARCRDALVLLGLVQPSGIGPEAPSAVLARLVRTRLECQF